MAPVELLAELNLNEKIHVRMVMNENAQPQKKQKNNNFIMCTQLHFFLYLC